MSSVVVVSTDDLRAMLQDIVDGTLRRKPLDSTVTSVPFIDKRSCAHALGVSTAKIDRLSRAGRIPFVMVGDVRRYDLTAVRATLAVHETTTSAPLAKAEAVPLHGVRLLGRVGR